MASSAPSTPLVRRSVTAPLRSTDSSRRDSLPLSPDPQIETLYAHPYAKVLSFNAVDPLEARPVADNGSSPTDEEPGTLPWSSRSERTIAVGPLRIYRTPNSVVFLNCGSVVRPIFQKSKCWCVEQASGKFVLEMRKPQYWRLEVPNNNEEDIRMMERLKDVLNEILLFEKTACPFRRNFTVALPPGAGTPVIYRPWRPRERAKLEQQSASMGLNEQPAHDVPAKGGSHEKEAGFEVLQVRRTRPIIEFDPNFKLPPVEASPGVSELRSNFEPSPIPNMPAIPKSIKPEHDTCGISTLHSSQTLDPLQSGPVSVLPDSAQEKCKDAAPESVSRSASFESGDIPHDEGYDTSGTAESELVKDVQAADEVYTMAHFPAARSQILQQPGDGLRASRSVTAPPQLTLVASPPSKRTRATVMEINTTWKTLPTSNLERSISIESKASIHSEADSFDSFHSVLSWHSPIEDASPTVTSTAATDMFPVPHENIIVPVRSRHAREVSELTAMPDTPKAWQDLPTICGAWPTEPADPQEVGSSDLLHDIDPEHFKLADVTQRDGTQTNLATLPPHLRSRATTPDVPRRRALSPLPPAANIVAPRKRKPRHLRTSRHLPTAIIQKTYEILVSPPSHLVKLMMEWAARIARDGLWGYSEYPYEHEGNDDLNGRYSDSHLDDYGISIEPLPSRTSSFGKDRRRSRFMKSGESWEMD